MSEPTPEAEIKAAFADAERAFYPLICGHGADRQGVYLAYLAGWREAELRAQWAAGEKRD